MANFRKSIRMARHIDSPAGSGNKSVPKIRIKMPLQANLAPTTTSSETPVKAAAPVEAPMPGVRHYQCPHCRAILETGETIEGMQVPCPVCGHEFSANRDQPKNMHADKLPKKKRRFGILQIVSAVLFCFQSVVCCHAYSNQSNPGGHIYMTADGHRKAAAVPILKSVSAIAYGTGMIPGIAPVVWGPAMAIGFGANCLANVVQRRADERWGNAMQMLQDHGIDPNNILGKYGY